MKSLTIFLLAPFCIFIGSCTCPDSIKCSTGILFLYSSDYTAHDLDTLIVKRYKQDGRFIMPIDSYNIIGHGHNMTDSFWETSLVTIQDSYDYIIIAPIIHKTYNVYNIVNKGEYEYSEKYRCGETPTYTSCSNDITTYYVNGIKVKNGVLVSEMVLQLTK